MIYQIFNLYSAVTTCKKLEKFNAWIFCKTQKTYFDLLFLQKPWSKIFPKKEII